MAISKESAENPSSHDVLAVVKIWEATIDQKLREGLREIAFRELPKIRGNLSVRDLIRAREDTVKKYRWVGWKVELGKQVKRDYAGQEYEIDIWRFS